MTTSGTTSQTVVTVQNLIDSGARRAGKIAETLTIEQVIAAKQSLYYVLSNLANMGIQYWKIVKLVVGTTPDDYVYSLPSAAVDVLNANYRTVTNVNSNPTSSSGAVVNAFDGQCTNICQLTTNTGYIQINNGAGSPVYISTVGILPAITGSVSANIQWSNDGTTWTTVYTVANDTWTTGQWVYYELLASATAVFWRILQTSGPNMGVYQVVFGTMPYAIPLARMNRDDYTNLPNRTFTNQRPLQYWFNRSIPQPQMYVWPAPNSYFTQFEVWYHSYIQDVGAVSGTLDIPQRWYLAVQDLLAFQMSRELPDVPPAKIAECKALADESWRLAEQEERDKSPIFFAPNISPYTR